MNRTIRALAFALAVTAAPAFAQEPAPPAPDLGKLGAAQAAQANLAVGVDEARTRVVKAVGWLLANQHPDGSWGAGAMDSVQFTNFSVETYFAFQYAANSLGFLALLAVDATPERDAAATKALEWLLTARIG